MTKKKREDVEDKIAKLLAQADDNPKAWCTPIYLERAYELFDIFEEWWAHNDKG